jgi:2-haloacid dehalogenase
VIKALLFDVFGTVVDWRSGVIRDVRRVAGPGRIDAAAFADAWRAGYGPAMDLVRRGELPWTKLDDLHRRTLDRLLAEFGLTTLAPEQQAWLNTCWHRLDPWPDVREGLRRLKQRYKPDPEFYLGAVEMLSLSPPEVMLVAAHNVDLRAAAAQGLATAFIPRPAEWGSHSSDGDDKPASDYTRVASDFTELAASLEA